MSERELLSKLDTAAYLLAQRKAVFLIAQHYWQVLGKSPVTEGLKVANLASAWAIDAIPFALALEGKNRYDLMMTMKVRPQDFMIDVQNYELNPKYIDFATSNHSTLRLIVPDASTYHQADIRELSIEDVSQDIVLLRNPNWKYDFVPDDVARVHNEIDRVLKPGGLYWSTYVLQKELDVSRANCRREDSILVDEPNLFPGPSNKFIIPETGEILNARFDSFVLIAQKAV